MRTRRRYVGLAVATLLAAALLGGCGSDTPTMMGASATRGATSAPGFAGSMMGSAPGGYHLRGATCSAPPSLPGSTVHVMLGDRGMTRMMGGVAPLRGQMLLRAVPARVPAGDVSFLVANMGWRTHELVVLPLRAGQQAGQREPGPDGRVDETGSLGEASAPCAEGSGDGITSGALGWVTLRLAPGRYELVCNLENHYANGMYQAFTVS